MEWLMVLNGSQYWVVNSTEWLTAPSGEAAWPCERGPLWRPGTPPPVSAGGPPALPGLCHLQTLCSLSPVTQPSCSHSKDPRLGKTKYMIKNSHCKMKVSCCGLMILRLSSSNSFGFFFQTYTILHCLLQIYPYIFFIFCLLHYTTIYCLRSAIISFWEFWGVLCLKYKSESPDTSPVVFKTPSILKNW